MTKSKRAHYRKGITWLNHKKYKVDGIGTQRIITIGGYHIVVGNNDYNSYIKFGEKCGINVTTRPRFSQRIGKIKSIKIGKYYISKLW